MELLNTVKTVEGLRELTEYLKDKDFIALDTETTGVGKDAFIIGYSVCAEPDVAYYVITRAWNKEKSALDVYETEAETPAFMQALVGKSLIMHNAVFDCQMVENNYKVSLMPSVHTDTMLLAHVLDENRRVGLKDLAENRYGAESKKEQVEMHASVTANGGVLTKDCYELYKADAELIAKYGAKDTILTYNLFYAMVPELYDENLDKFFYEEETMPLLRGTTYSLNTAGLKVDTAALQTLKKELEVEILQLKEFIYAEIRPYINSTYPGTNKKNTFNIGSDNQITWLLFKVLGNTFPKLGDVGRELCRAKGIYPPRTKAEKLNFIELLGTCKGQVWREPGTVWDKKTRKYKGAAKVREWWTYCSADKTVLQQFAGKYRWVEKLLEYKNLTKLLSTYVEGIEERLDYGVIHPSFLQHGTTSGRYSSREPNFQNLPRKDKRVKSCIVARPGNVFVGADYEQLEPRVFASVSRDPSLINCFRTGEDFYSVVGAPIFGHNQLSRFKSDPRSFAVLHPDLRDRSKVIALATPYGRTARQQASAMGISEQESAELIRNYFDAYPCVEQMMLDSHEEAKKNGVVYSLFGRPRRIPAAMEIPERYGNVAHGDLPYEARGLLNLAMNHKVQSSAASIMNRASIMCWNTIQERGKTDPRWLQVRIVLQVHDELVLEGPEALAEEMVKILKHSMECAVELPDVALVAEPKVAKKLSDLK